MYVGNFLGNLMKNHTEKKMYPTKLFLLSWQNILLSQQNILFNQQNLFDIAKCFVGTTKEFC